MNKFKAIFISILSSIWRDIESGYDSLSKPKEVLNLIFWLMVILVVTEKMKLFWYSVFAYFVVYFWKIIKQGEWRRRLKENI